VIKKTGQYGGARAEILRRVRAAVAGAPPVTVPRDYHFTRPDIDLVELFIERLTDYKARVHRGEEAIATCLDGVSRLAVPAGIPRRWLSAYQGQVLTEPLTTETLDTVDAVLTGCALAIAETGTLVLDAGPDQGTRALTLIPDHHICVVRREQIVGGVPEAVRRLNPTRPLTWISGPSATSDIELNRVEGVHGPRRLDVVLVE